MSVHQLHSRHERSFESNRFVYPVLSRRSQGISIGVNLNPDKVCNFDCIYCQVDRTRQSETQFVEIDALLAELDDMLEFVTSGRIYAGRQFAQTPATLRRLNDIAFSGDGEPTTYRNFDAIIDACAALKRRRGLDDVKLALITNASMFHRSHVQRGLEILDENNGEIWAKLDAGTEQYFNLVERTPIRFQQILDNISAAAAIRPLVVQSLFMRIDGQPPSVDEIDAFCARIIDVVAQGGRLKLVQVYTVARRPAEGCVTPLSDAEVDGIVQAVQSRTGVHAAGYYGKQGE